MKKTPFNTLAFAVCFLGLTFIGMSAKQYQKSKQTIKLTPPKRDFGFASTGMERELTHNKGNKSL